MQMQDVKLVLLSIPVCIYVWLSRELCEVLYSYQNADSSGLRLFALSSFLTACPTFWALNVWSSVSVSLLTD